MYVPWIKSILMNKSNHLQAKCILIPSPFLLSFKFIRTLLWQLFALSFPRHPRSSIVFLHYCISVQAPYYMSLENKYYALFVSHPLSLIFFNANIHIGIMNTCYFQLSLEVSLETHPTQVYATTTPLKHPLSRSSVIFTWLYLLSKKLTHR